MDQFKVIRAVGGKFVYETVLDLTILNDKHPWHLEIISNSWPRSVAADNAG